MTADASPWRPVRLAIETGAARVAERLVRVLPDRSVARVGSILGWLAYVVDARHRRVAIDNVRRAYGSSMPAAAQRRLVRRSFGHFGRVAVEMLRFGRLSKDSAGRIATFEGIQHLGAASARRRGVLICAAHFGNWELHALLQGWAGYPVTLVTRPMDNPGLERLIARLRAGSGNTIISKRLSMSVAMRALRQGETIGILVDQRPRRSGIPVPFFGRPAFTSSAPALLALRTGAALVPAFSVPRSGGGYRLVYEPEIAVERTGDIEADVRRLTDVCTRAVERWVRQNPEIWFWMHDRWRAPR